MGKLIKHETDRLDFKLTKTGKVAYLSIKTLVQRETDRQDCKSIQSINDKFIQLKQDCKATTSSKFIQHLTDK